jgi:hypothetical protein
MLTCMPQSDVECLHVHTQQASFEPCRTNCLRSATCIATERAAGVSKIEATGPGSGYKFKVGQRVVAGNW